LLFSILLGRLKLNLFLRNFGKVKDDCLKALQIKDDEQVFYILCRSRMFLDKYGECIEFCKKALSKYADSKRIKDLMKSAMEENKKEEDRIGEIKTIARATQDKKMEVYRVLRGKGVKMGKRIEYLPEEVDLQISVDADGKLHFPVILLYGEYMTSDFIQVRVE